MRPNTSLLIIAAVLAVAHAVVGVWAGDLGTAVVLLCVNLFALAVGAAYARRFEPRQILLYVAGYIALFALVAVIAREPLLFAIFGLLYAAVLFAVAASKEHFGDEGLYIVAALSGLTDMDAITLSTSRMIDKGQLAIDTGWRMILVGALSNLVFKGAAIALLGHRRLLLRIIVAFGIALASGVLILLLWP